VRRIVRRATRLLRQLGRAVKAELRAAVRRGPIRSGTVLYESFAGNGALCNPEALFRELLRASDLTNLRHIWVLDSLRAHRAIRAEYAGDPRVRFVRYRSLAYHRALATSQYLINNATFPPEFSKRDGQVYINTWHGTPLKQMGYDMPNGAMDSANTIRNFVAADYLLSQNSFMTEQMYEKAYKLRGIFNGLIIEEGYPRVDHQFLDQEHFLKSRADLESSGVDLGDRSIVLYAPTWKGDSFSNPEDDARQLLETVVSLQALLGDEQYVVLLKTHQIVHRYAAANPAFAKLLVPNDMPTNTILGLSSALITDYSSIFFDFLATDRPIIFYTPDVDEYSESRGTYFSPATLPGPVCSTLEELHAAIIEAGTDPQEQSARAGTRETWKERFVPNDDGLVSRRVIDVVFRGEHRDHRVLSIGDDSRTRVLLHLGGMRSNGITSSALYLLNFIDHTRYDVSVIFTRPLGAQQRANQARVDPRVRQFHRAGGMNGSKFSHLRRKLADRRQDASLHVDSPSQRRLWDDEWNRCFGQSRFDIVADFSGYTAFWAILLLHSPDARRSIWLHNDMSAEANRVIRGRRRMRRSLPAVFALYRGFDALVSVSPSLRELNRKALGTRFRLRDDQFAFARNIVDDEHVLNGMRADLRELQDHPIDVETGEIHVPEWASEMLTDDGSRWFVTVGRFSTEKNHARLLRAFALVHLEYPDSRLVIVGYGPLRAELERTVDALKLTGAAFIVGPYSNPFPIVAAADCFVLSSNYEGQPMALLEAAIIGMPIVSVDFESVHDALPGDEIHVVPQDDESLARGMRSFLRGEVTPATLDVDGYNRSAIEEFHAATGNARMVRKPSRESGVQQKAIPPGVSALD
jgi:CDP-glycerol glycerophosphotransferase